MILTRSEFTQHFKNLDHRIDGDDPFCALWVPEEHDHITCQWFVCVRPLSVHKFKRRYYDWCDQALHGQIRCFSSDQQGQQEWWGFTDRKDIALWMLKWT